MYVEPIGGGSAPFGDEGAPVLLKSSLEPPEDLVDELAAAIKKFMARVFLDCAENRTVRGARTFATAVCGFATKEAVSQVYPRDTDRVRRTKTWRHHGSKNPRSSHAAMDGETVGLDERFSNGADYPGDLGLPAEEAVNCHCTMDVGVEKRFGSLPIGFEGTPQSFENVYSASVSGLNIVGVDNVPDDFDMGSYLRGEYGIPTPMSFDDADHGNCNPGSSDDEGRDTNCQVCVAVYELRRRGYNVVAKPRPYGDERYKPLVDNPASAWIDRLRGRPVTSHDFMGFHEGEGMSIVDGDTAQAGRYLVSIARPGRAGHVAVAERDASGVLTAFDAQSGMLYGRDEFFAEYEDARMVSVARIDNADIIPELIADFIEVA